jgi:hypothetical protein
MMKTVCFQNFFISNKIGYGSGTVVQYRDYKNRAIRKLFVELGTYFTIVYNKICLIDYGSPILVADVWIK